MTATIDKIITTIDGDDAKLKAEKATLQTSNSTNADVIASNNARIATIDAELKEIAHAKAILQRNKEVPKR